MTAVPADPAIYHILHVDRLSSVIATGGLLCDTTVTAKNAPGTVIGMHELKAHRLTRTIDGHPGLTVGACVPFYFCSKSVMLYVIHRANHPNVDVVLFEPRPDGDRMKRHRKREAPALTPLRAVLIRLIDRYRRGLMEPEVTLLEIHKLAYFLQQAGMPMRLRFTKGHYGLYAENLRHVMREMEGYYLAGYGDGGDEPEKLIEIVPGALEAAADAVADDPEVAAAFDQIAALVEGFETPFGLELLATTHWAVNREGAWGVEQIGAVFRDWNEHKSSFAPRQIGIAFERLESQGWSRGAGCGTPHKRASKTR